MHVCTTFVVHVQEGYDLQTTNDDDGIAEEADVHGLPSQKRRSEKQKIEKLLQLYVNDNVGQRFSNNCTMFVRIAITLSAEPHSYSVLKVYFGVGC